ncbi:hypothetical protein V8G54_014722 [Vigna mungo]|uniref:Uncharacterized protein n=1 Tax=Vigna mungo TaxID=3915 RepID=A0AAQ3NKL2_VIGMU
MKNVKSNLFLCQHRTVANSDYNPALCHLGRCSEEETVAVMQSVKGATDDDGLVGVGWRERRKHHEHRVMLILNRHSMCSNCFRSKHEKGVVLGRCQDGYKICYIDIIITL